MDDYILQRDLPEYFKKNAVVLDRTGFIYRGWHYNEARELTEWLKSSSYIISGIQVFSPGGFDLRYFRGSWYFHGDRTKNKEENIDANFSEAFKFLERFRSITDIDIVYEVIFRSEKDMDEITREYFYKSILRSGYNYEIREALEIIERCRVMKKKINGVEVMQIEDPYIQPMGVWAWSSGVENMEPSKYFQMYHHNKGDDPNNWKKTKQIIKENTGPKIYYQITHE